MANIPVWLPKKTPKVFFHFIGKISLILNMNDSAKAVCQCLSMPPVEHILGPI